MKKIQFYYTHQGEVAEILLNDGKGNVLDQVMVEEILNVFDEIKENSSVKLVKFEGAGKHFSFGASIEEHKKESVAMMLKTFHSLFYKMIDLGIPTLAKVSGQCLGGGMELAIACNIIIADRTARFGQPEIVLGVFPPPASVILPIKIGTARAEELIITGRVFDADEALSMGLVTKVYDDKELMQKGVEEWIIENILPKSASSLRYAVRAVRSSFNHIVKGKLPQLEEIYVNQLMETKDANEGVISFIEKREPIWQNC